MGFHAQGLMFREVEEADLELLRQWRNDPAMTSGWSDPRSVQTMDRQQEWYRTLSATNQAFMATDKDHNVCDAIVGMLRFRLDYEHQEARLTGTDVMPTMQGKGYGRRILRAGAEYVLRDLGFHRCTAEALAENTAAIKIIQAACFRPEGVLRSAVWRDGHWCNWHLFSLLREEL